MWTILITLTFLIGSNTLASDYIPEYDPQAEQAMRSSRWPLPTEGQRQDKAAPYNVIPPPEVIYQEWLNQMKLMNRYWCPDIEIAPEPQTEAVRLSNKQSVNMIKMYWEDFWRARNPLQFEENNEKPQTIKYIKFEPEKPVYNGQGLTIITIEF